MRVLIFLILFLSSCDSATAQKPARLIIRGDDMGYSHAGNEALIKAYKAGIEKSIEVIVPSPWFPEAVRMLEANPAVDVGVHLALTSEWDNIKWRPLTDCKSLKDEDGYFYPMIWPNKNYPGKSVTENKWKLSDIEMEFRAQIELALKKIPRVSHISAHMGCTDIDESVRELTKRLSAEYKIEIDLAKHGVSGMHYDGPTTTLADKKKSFMSALRKLEPGKTYLFVDHPGIDTPELQAIHHIGYENVAADRQGVTSLWTDEEVIKLIRELKIELISYKDLLRGNH